MVVACHLGGRLGMECGLRWLGGIFGTVDWGKINPESADKRRFRPSVRHAAMSEKRRGREVKAGPEAHVAAGETSGKRR